MSGRFCPRGATPREWGTKLHAKGCRRVWQKTPRGLPLKKPAISRGFAQVEAGPKTHVFRQAYSPAGDAKPTFNASSVWARRLSVQFCPFRGVTPTCQMA